MSDDLSRDEIEWFEIAERSLQGRQAERPEFSASVILDALKTDILSGVRYGELAALDSQLWEFFNEVSIPKPKPGENLNILVLSWLAATFRNSHSSFLLSECGFRDTAAANARVALDHSIYLSLLAKGDERERVTARMEALYVNYLKSFGNMTATNAIMEEFVQMASEELPKVDPGKKSWSDIVEQVCNRLSSGDIVYSQYRILSNMIHPGLASSEPFVYGVQYDDSSYFRWKPVINPAPTVAFMAVASCAWAAWSVDELLGENYFGEVLEPIAIRLRLHKLFDSAPQ